MDSLFVINASCSLGFPCYVKSFSLNESLFPGDKDNAFARIIADRKQDAIGYQTSTPSVVGNVTQSNTRLTLCYKNLITDIARILKVNAQRIICESEMVQDSSFAFASCQSASSSDIESLFKDTFR
jgi:hypothetical protein